MKLSINQSFQENASNQSLLILVDSEQVQHATNTYQINNLNTIIESTQFKATLAETLPLIGQVSHCTHSVFVGIGKATELKAAKLSKIAQTITLFIRFEPHSSGLFF